MTNRPTIIGVTGTHASGKDTVAEYVAKKLNLKSHSTSDELRREATRRGVDHSRASLIVFGNLIRAEFGLGELAKRAFENLPPNTEMALITGIRNPGEVEYLKEHSDFYLISVDGPIELRYERAMKRSRDGEFRTFENFRKGEETEMKSEDKAGQQLITCMRMADYFIINDSSVEELEMRTDEIIKAILSLHNLKQINDNFTSGPTVQNN